MPDAKNPTWITTTAGGSPTQVAEPFEVVTERLRSALATGDPVISLTVNNAGEGFYRRVVIVSHIVQIGDTTWIRERPDHEA